MGGNFIGFFPYMGEILWVFLTFMEVFPIPPLSRGRSGWGWGIYVAVVLKYAPVDHPASPDQQFYSHDEDDPDKESFDPDVSNPV